MTVPWAKKQDYKKSRKWGKERRDEEKSEEL
jgi:hypothetical protein